METWGDRFPRLREVPGYEEMASRPTSAPLHGDYLPAIPTDDRLRVGIVCPCLMQGGGEAWQLALARSVDASRIHWTGLVITDGAMVNPQIRSRFEALMPVGIGRESVPSLARESDILVTWAIDDLPSLIERATIRPRTVSVVHAPVESMWGRSVFAASKTDKFVAVSELAARAIPAEHEAFTITNAVDESRLIQKRSVTEMRASWGVPEGCKVAGFYQRLSAEKDPYAAIRLAREIPDDWRVVVVGDGFERARMVEMSQGLDRLILTPGPDDDAGSVLRAFDVLVCASDYESFGLTMAEGLWLGIPVVSTWVGIAKIHTGITHLVPMKAEGTELARMVSEAHAMGSPKGYEGVVAGFSTARFGREWTEFLCGLTDPRAKKLARVNACPERGSEIPVSEYPAGCCPGGTLHQCRAGKGENPGKVKLAECCSCREKT